MNRFLFICATFSFSIGLAGCAFTSNHSTCYAGPLHTTQSSGSAPSVSIPNQDVTIYPGQTTQVAVDLGASPDTVTLSGTNLPQGVTIASASTPGSTSVSLNVTASADVMSSCFTGAEYLYTAAAPITVSAKNSKGTSTAQFALNVVLENPSFIPATTSGLPILSITTVANAPVDSEDDYVDATMTLTDPTDASNNYTGTTEIKGHGNSTWLMPKKPYRLNMDSKAPLLGMTSDSNWILLANYDDKPMIRNAVSMQVSNLFGMAWTPSMRFIEFYLNGVYEGTYQLSEKVEVSKARLNIGSIDVGDDSGADVTGGYLGEIDHTDSETLMITSNVGLPVGLADPDPPESIQAAYFENAFNPAEKSFYAVGYADPTTGWRSQWDETSLINWYLIQEFTGNQDSNDWSDEYFYKPRSVNTFYMGPIWDMDQTFGNTNHGAITSPTVMWVRTQALWQKQLFTDPLYLANVKARWATVRPSVLMLSDFIDQQAAALDVSQQNNFQRWTILGEKVFPNSEAAGSYQGEVAFLKSWLQQRIAFMDANYLN